MNTPVTPIKPLSVAEALVATMNRYGVILGGADLALWMEDLQGIEPAAAIAALKAHRIDPDAGRWAPKPADIIKRVQGGNEEHALHAWNEVYRGIRQLGPYKSVRFADPLSATIVGELGGWGALCETSSFDMGKRQKDFIAGYMKYASRKMIPTHALGYVRGEFDGEPVSVPAIGAEPAPLAIAPPRQLPAVSAERVAQVKAEYRNGVTVRLKTVEEADIRCI